jgi:AraC family transcriptional regulator
MTRPAKPAARILARGADWRLTEFVCTSGPGDRPFEERHDGTSIAAVVAGTFGYRTDTGAAFLHRGALLLGNSGACFECGHAHGTGDVCLSLHFPPGALDAAARNPRFARAAIPAGPEAQRLIAAFHALGSERDPLRADEIAARIAARGVALASGDGRAQTGAKPGDERRIARALRLIDARAEDALDLDALAREAAMSKFHFLRVFARLTGTTPYRYVRDVRLGRAAERLTREATPVARVAFECGFGDLSTFVGAFRRRYGAPPSAFRRDPAASIDA